MSFQQDEELKPELFNVNEEEDKTTI